MEELSLEGNKYKGKFFANQFSREVQVGSHYTEHDETMYYYKGKGLITKLDSGEETRFLLHTKSSFDSSIPFEEYMIWIYNNEECRKADNFFIVNKFKVIDLVLSSMYNKAKEGLDEEIIPNISPPNLNYEELVEKGFMKDRDGQIRLGLIFKESQPTH